MTSRDDQYRALSESRNRNPLYEFALSTMDFNGVWRFNKIFATDSEAAVKGQEWVKGKFCRDWKIDAIKKT